MPRKKNRKGRPSRPAALKGQEAKSQLPGKFKGKPEKLRPSKDEGGGGILGTGIGPDVGPEIAKNLGGVAESALSAALPAYGGQEDVKEGTPLAHAPGLAQQRQLGAAAELTTKSGNPVVDSWNNTIGKAVNPALRTGFVASQAPSEFVTGKVREAAQEISRGTGIGGLGGAFPALAGALGVGPEEAVKGEARGARAGVEQTTAFQAGKIGVEKGDLGAAIGSTGKGILPSPTSPAGKAQAEAAKQYSPYLIAGHAWTPGRAIAGGLYNATGNEIFEPDSTAFDNLSGTVDAAYTVATDPTLWTGRPITEARQRARTVSAFAPEGEEITKALGTRRGQRFSEGFAKATTPEDLNAVTKNKVAFTPEMQSALIEADTPARVNQVLTGQGQPVSVPKFEPGAEPGAAPVERRVAAKITKGEQTNFLELAGGRRGVRKYVEGNTVQQFMSTPAFGRLRDRITEAGTSQRRIMEAIPGLGKEDGMKVYGELKDANKRIAAGADPHVIDDVLYPRLGVTENKLPKSRFGYQFRRKTHNMRILDETPDASLKWEDPHQVVTTLEQGLKNSHVPFERRASIIDNYLDATSSKANRYQTIKATSDSMKEVMLANKVKPEKADEILQWFNKGEDTAHNQSVYWASQDPNVPVTPSGIVHGDGTAVNFSEDPMSYNELLNQNVAMPDFREVRRQTSFLKPLWTNGLVGAGTAGLEHYMNVWKLGKLFRPALGIRVVGEEQFRMAAAGMTSLVNNPAAAIGVVTGTPHSGLAQFVDRWAERFHLDKNADIGKSELPGYNAMQRDAGLAEGGVSGGIMGEPGPTGRQGITGRLATTLERRHQARGTRAADIYGAPFDGRNPRNALSEGMNTRFNAIYGSEKHKAYRNTFSVLSRDQGDTFFTQGAEGLVDELDRLSDPLFRRAAAREDMGRVADDFWQGNLRPMREDMARNEQFDFLARDRASSDAYVQSVYDRIDQVTAGDDRLRNAIQSGDIDGEAIVSRGGGTNPKAVRKVEGILREGAGPNRIKVQDSFNIPSTHSAQRLAAAKQGVDTFFAALMPRPSDYLSRSSTFRQIYWNEVERLTPLLDSAERPRLIEGAAQSHLDKGFLQSDQLDRIKSKPSVVSAGDERMLNFDQMDVAAKSRALDGTKDLLYDLSKRSQIFDMLRLVIPFGEAWKEVTTTWARLLWRDPSIARKGQLAINGARDSGFFSKNENGEEVFNIPGSEYMTQGIPGAEHLPGPLGDIAGGAGGAGVPLEAPVSGLSLMTSGFPGVGPVAQIPLQKLMQDKPEYDWARDVIFPFGEPPTTGDPFSDIAKQVAPFPSFVNRIIAAYADPEQYREFGNIVGHQMQYNLSTNEYDIHNGDPKIARREQDRLYNDSKEQAKGLLLRRAVVQAISPSAPSANYQVIDKDGKTVDAGEMAKEWRQLTENTNVDYGSAYEAFIDTHGESNMLITQAFTEPVKGFLPITKEADQWALKNPEIRALYPQTYGLFAPSEGDFDIEAWGKLLSRGERKSLTPQEMLEKANDRAANYIYRTERDTLTEKERASEDGRDYLGSLKDTLAGSYPGYKPDSFDPGKNPALITEIEQAASDPAVIKAAPRMTRGINEYLNERAAMIADSDGGNLRGKNDKKRRDHLRDFGADLSIRYRGFSRVFTYVFDNELSS